MNVGNRVGESEEHAVNKVLTETEHKAASAGRFVRNRSATMNTEERLERLEKLAFNQTLIIEHLTNLVRDSAPEDFLALALEVCAEAMLVLVFEQQVPIDALDLTIDWRLSLAGTREIMQIS